MGKEIKDQDIRTLGPNEHVRLRPGMYVGGVDERALHHLIYEVIANGVEEAMVGRCDHIWISLGEDNEVRIQDNGPSIPVEMNASVRKNTLEIMMTFLLGVC